MNKNREIRKIERVFAAKQKTLFRIQAEISSPNRESTKLVHSLAISSADFNPFQRQSRAGCWVFASRCSETGTVDTRSATNVIPAFGAEARYSRKGKHRVSGNRRVMCRACQGGGPDPGNRVSVPVETKLTGAMGFPKAL